jgi:hypothetical protein
VQLVREIFSELLPRAGLSLTESWVEFAGDELNIFIDDVLQAQCFNAPGMEEVRSKIEAETKAMQIALKTGDISSLSPFQMRAMELMMKDMGMLVTAGTDEIEDKRQGIQARAGIHAVPAKRQSLDQTIKQLEEYLLKHPSDKKTEIALAYANKEGGDPYKTLAYFQGYMNDKAAFLGYVATVIDQQMLRSAWPAIHDGIKFFEKEPDILFSVGFFFWSMFLSPNHSYNREQNLKMAMGSLSGCLQMQPENVRINIFSTRVARLIGENSVADMGERKFRAIDSKATKFWLNLPFSDSRWIPQPANPFIDMEGNEW